MYSCYIALLLQTTCSAASADNTRKHALFLSSSVVNSIILKQLEFIHACNCNMVCTNLFLLTRSISNSE